MLDKQHFCFYDDKKTTNATFIIMFVFTIFEKMNYNIFNHIIKESISSFQATNGFISPLYVSSPKNPQVTRNFM